MHVFLVWKRRCVDVRAGTQAPPLRILLERITRGCSPLHISFGQIACVVLFVGKTVHMNQHHRCCTFDSPGLPTIGGATLGKVVEGNLCHRHCTFFNQSSYEETIRE